MTNLPSPTRDPQALKADLATLGYCLIDRALDPATLAAVQDRLFRQAAAERRLHNKKNPANTDPVSQWVGMLLNKGEIFLKLVQDPLAMSLMEHMIGPDYLLSCIDAQIQHPGSGTMPLHSDQWWMPKPQQPGLPAGRPADARRNAGSAVNPGAAGQPIAPMAAANVMWMITDFTEENGATRIVPGSHLSGAEPDSSVPHKVASVPGRSCRVRLWLRRPPLAWRGAQPHRCAALWHHHGYLRPAIPAARELQPWLAAGGDRPLPARHPAPPGLLRMVELWPHRRSRRRLHRLRRGGDERARLRQSAVGKC